MKKLEKTPTVADQKKSQDNIAYKELRKKFSNLEEELAFKRE